jgi:hypothetical protein
MELKLDTTIRNGAVDAPTAKAAARNVKQRLSALGHEIGLNHAYEAVAAMGGYPTWAVMKASLEAGSALSPQAPATVKPFPVGVMDWETFSPGTRNPTALFFGPAGRRRAGVMTFLRDEWVKRYQESVGEVAFLRTITFVSRNSQPADDKDQGERVRISKEFSDIAIFDLPLGQRYPAPAHRERIIEFVAAVTISFYGGKLSEGDRRALVEPIPRMVDQAYALRNLESPWLYRRSVLEDIDSFDGKAGFDFAGSQATWWDVSDALAGKYLTKLATWARAQAVPSLNDLTFMSRQADMGGVLSGGEKVADCIARALSSALREFGALRGERKPRPIEEFNPIEVIEIVDQPSDPRANRLMLLLAVNRYRMLVDAVEADETTRTVYKPARLPRSGTPMRLSVSLPDTPVPLDGVVKIIFDDAVMNGREVVVFTDDPVAAADHLDISSSYFVHGCSTHDDVGTVAALFGFDKSAADLIHDHMVGAGLESREGVPMLACRRKFHMTDMSALILRHR